MSRPPGVVLERRPYDPQEWDRTLARYPRAEVFHSSAWLAYLSATQDAELVLAAVLPARGGPPAGHFVGALVRRYGMRMLGSPMPGWATQHLGFLLDPDVPHPPTPLDLARALTDLAFGPLRCVHLELSQRGLTGADLAGSGFTAVPGATYLVDLDAPEDAILSRMHPRTRTYVRRAARTGLTVEDAGAVTGGEEFAAIYHAQLSEVFARQGLAPTYGLDRVRQLVRALGPSGQLLLSLVRGPDGAPLASGISVGRGQLAVNWGTASTPAGASLHPNDLLWWHLLSTWRARGATCLDMGGRGDYKAKYGGVPLETERFHASRPAVLGHGRVLVERLVALRQARAGRRAVARVGAVSP
jgi:hypothetical protein